MPGATPAQVEQAIETSAVPIPGVASGRVDAYGTLRALVPERPAAAVTPAPGGATQPEQRSGGATPTGGTTIRTKVVAGRIRRGKNASVVLKTGPGLLQANVKTRARNRAIRLRLVAAGRVVASARGVGGARLRAEVRAGRYRLVISTTSRKPSSFVLMISYPAARP